MSSAQAEVFVGLACDSECGFCTQECLPKSQDRFSIERIMDLLQYLRREKRVNKVIITGGEPTLPRYAQRTLELLRAIRDWSWELKALYTNGEYLFHALDKLPTQLEAFNQAGLIDLNLSRHHSDHGENVSIFKRELPRAEDIARESGRLGMRLRLNGVLMKGWVDSLAEISRYLDWAIELDVCSVYLRHLFNFVESSFYRPKDYDTRGIISFTREHAVDSDGIARQVAADSRFSEVQQHPKSGGQGRELCALYRGILPVVIADLRVGNDVPGQGNYWAILPDGKLRDTFTANQVVHPD